MGGESDPDVEGTRASHRAHRGPVLGQTHDAVRTWVGARLHAREGDGLRRHLFIGSFNLSHSGESNAENVLEIKDAALAERLAAYVDEVRARYPAVELL